MVRGCGGVVTMEMRFYHTPMSPRVSSAGRGDISTPATSFLLTECQPPSLSRFSNSPRAPRTRKDGQHAANFPPGCWTVTKHPGQTQHCRTTQTLGVLPPTPPPLSPPTLVHIHPALSTWVNAKGVRYPWPRCLPW